MMKLYWSSRSPFARIVMIAAHEVGLANEIETIRVISTPAQINPEVMKVNPRGQIPVLVDEAGTRFFDSRVICEYLDSLHDGRRIFPPYGPLRWTALQLQAIGHGIAETAVHHLREERREACALNTYLETGRAKMVAMFDDLELRSGSTLSAVEPTIGDIAVFAALAYVDFRLPTLEWRDRRPNLASWFASFSQRESAQATGFEDVI